MIYIKIYLLISGLICSLSLGLRLYFYDFDFVLLKFIVASFLISVPISIGVKIFYGDKIDEAFRRNQ